jgi:DNA-binding transcriptional LysR family regulator
MGFTVTQLRTFRSIVANGTFAAAATELGVTQPSVSQRIRELETALDVRLFVRHGPHIRLTPDGEALIPYADRVLATVADVLDHFRARDPLSGLLRLGVTDSFAMIALPDLLQRLAQHHPGLKTSVRVGDTAIIMGLLDVHEIDIAVGPLSGAGPHIHCEPIGRNTLGWFAAAQFGIAPGVITPGELALHHLMCAGPSSRLYRTAMDWFAESDVVPEQVSTCNSLEVTARAILSGHAIGLLPVRVMRDQLAQGKVRRLTVTRPFPSLEFSIGYQAADASASVQAVVDFTREVVAAHELYV